MDEVVCEEGELLYMVTKGRGRKTIWKSPTPYVPQSVLEK